MNDLITCVCPTFNRPELLGRSIRSFEKQSYKNRYLVIVDDAGQFDNQKGDRWELISLPRRVLSLGQKRNIAASLVPPETVYYAVWDDDDLYMPWHLEALAEAFGRGARFVQPRTAIDFWDGEWVQVETFPSKTNRPPAWHKKAIRNKMPRLQRHYAYHGCWGYSRELFEFMGGYRPLFSTDDVDFQKRVMKEGIQSFGTDETKFLPSYFYNRLHTNRISEIDKGSTFEGYSNREEGEYVGKIPVWKDDSIFEQSIPTKRIVRQF